MRESPRESFACKAKVHPTLLDMLSILYFSCHGSAPSGPLTGLRSAIVHWHSQTLQLPQQLFHTFLVLNHRDSDFYEVGGGKNT